MTSHTSTSDLFDAGVAAWPALPIERSAFERHVLALGADHSPELSHAGDLYLACGCALRLDDALAAFEERFAPILVAAISRVDRSPNFVDDAAQTLRIKLFVRDPPKIGSYGARAKLSTWLTTFAVRSAMDQRKSRGAPTVGASLLEGLDAGASPELDYMRRRYKMELEEAITAALELLTPRDRGLLRLHLGERMSIDRLAVAYGVGRSTAARWLAAARESLFDHTEREVRARLGATASEVQDLGRALRSQLEVSLLRLLDGPRG